MVQSIGQVMVKRSIAVMSVGLQHIKKSKNNGEIIIRITLGIGDLQKKKKLQQMQLQIDHTLTTELCANRKTSANRCSKRLKMRYFSL